MSEPKTTKNDRDVATFLAEIDDDQKRQDCQVIAALMQEATGNPPAMWGESIVGFGAYHYKYASGHEGDAPLVAFSPRKQNLTLYIVSGFDQYQPLLARLGKHKTGKACLYIKRLADVDLSTLHELIKLSVDHMRKTNNAL
jgi:hypothetical protein